MSEAQLTKAVLSIAKLNHWRSAHFRTAQTARGNFVTPVAGDGKGFPDLVLVRGERLIFAELKMGSTLRPDQRKWLDALRDVPGVEVYLWRGGDYPFKIAQVLA